MSWGDTSGAMQEVYFRTAPLDKIKHIQSNSIIWELSDVIGATQLFVCQQNGFNLQT